MGLPYGSHIKRTGHNPLRRPGVNWWVVPSANAAPPCFGRHVKPLVPAAFAVVSTHQSTLGTRGGLWPVLLMCNP
jgi:hypothetical protein